VNYLREVARTLEVGGRIFASFFVLDRESREVMASRETFPQFTQPFEHGLVADPDSPDVAVAFNGEWLHRVFLDCGFVIEMYQQGSWRDHTKSDELYQDMTGVWRCIRCRS
jgi:hypothetical protein